MTRENKVTGNCRHQAKEPCYTASISGLTSARLETLRGIAAIVVAVFHSLLVIQGCPASSQLLVPEAIFVFNGRAAVTLFFVLSGFVLGLSLWRSKGPFGRLYVAFAVRRVMRIYPALLASTTLVLLVLWMGPIRPYSTQSSFVNSYFPADVSLGEIFANLFLVKHSLNDVTWTLRMEMVGSLLLPFVWMASQRMKLFPVFLLPICLAGVIMFPLVTSVAVLPAFVMGFGVTLTRPIWQSIANSRRVSCACLALGLGLLLLPKPISMHYRLPFGYSYLPDALGAALLISAIVFGANLAYYKFLDFPILRWAGRLSYSYYLLQPLALIVLSVFGLNALLDATSHDRPLMCAAALWMGSSLAAFPLAALFYRSIEAPCISWSKALASGKVTQGGRAENP